MEEDFVYDGVTMKCLNPEAIPIFKKNLAKLILKLSKIDIDEEASETNFSHYED
ncbi:hypothetical protein [Clostridium diolis]|uniref:Uncharacterized protein n=1 Tax=Clostridium diolis TaxID=223919 RepID=A0AAV3W5M0_9CLOT|nr:hypothetical protein [Clostridium diolis]GEA33613.1 hypothetical protein CDIOL_45360 [Clostridium diolis]